MRSQTTMTRRQLAALAGASMAAASIGAGVGAVAPAGASSPPPHARGGHHLYVHTNDPDGNSVHVYRRTPSGGLEPAGTFPTGGRGGALDGAVVDRLASQGAVTYDGRSGRLYAVNAGSDTLTVFRADGARLTGRQVVGTGGSFPVSVTVHGSFVYVLNARDGGSVQGFRWERGTLRRVAGWRVGLGLDDTGLPEFTHTPGHIRISPDGRQLIVTTKAVSHSVAVFAVAPDGRPHRTPKVTQFDGQVPFAVDFDRHGRLAVVFAGTNSVGLHDLRRDGSLRGLAEQATGQRASCWIVGIGDALYVSNAGSASVTRLTSSRPHGLVLHEHTPTGPGTVDAAASSDGRFLYVQTGADGMVDVFGVNRDGTLSPRGSVTVPGTVGGEGLAAS